MTKAKKHYEKKRIDKKTKRKIRHVVTWSLLIVSVLFSIFRFPVVFNRTLQAIVDLLYSLLHFLLWYVDMRVVQQTLYDMSLAIILYEKGATAFAVAPFS